MLKGSDEPLPPEVRDYQLIRLTGWTFTELDQQSAVRCDWLLAVDNVFRKVENDG